MIYVALLIVIIIALAGLSYVHDRVTKLEKTSAVGPRGETGMPGLPGVDGKSWKGSDTMYQDLLLALGGSVDEIIHSDPAGPDKTFVAKLGKHERSVPEYGEDKDVFIWKPSAISEMPNKEWVCQQVIADRFNEGCAKSNNPKRVVIKKKK